MAMIVKWSLVAVVMLAGCASSGTPGGAPKAAAAQPAASTKQKDGDKLVCTTERQLGSNIVRKRCLRQSDIDESKQQIDQQLKQPAPQMVKGG